MPNHVEHDMWVRGSTDELVRFRSFADGGKEGGLLDAEKLIPYPPEFSPMTQEAYNRGGYEWCLSNWGTKWGMYKAKLVSISDNCLQYSFNTAWSPAEPVYKAMAARFPNLEFEIRYFECGMCFQGVYKFSDGELQESGQEEYHGDRGG